jgi:hypothetical protein
VDVEEKRRKCDATLFANGANRFGMTGLGAQGHQEAR